MQAELLQTHFDALMKLYADFSLREFRFKEGKTEDIREEARRLCAIYKDQCQMYVQGHPELQQHLFGKEKGSLGLDEARFFSWEHFSSSLGSALAQIQEALD